MTLRAYVERGDKRAFASVIEWPGWSRAGKTEDEAIRALVAYGPRYRAVVRSVDRTFDPPADPSDVVVEARLKGGSGTDFGVPGLPAPDDDRPIEARELDRLVAILKASWRSFDRAAAAAEGRELTKGPRGGGRDLEKIVMHAFESDRAYVTQAGGRFRATKGAPPREEWPRLRRRLLEVLDARARGLPVEDAANVKRPWLPRYVVRRTAWHVLDHAWEIEDRARPDRDRA